MVALAGAGLADGWVLFGSGSDPDAGRLTPGALSSAQEAYDGDRVEAVGVVRRVGPENGATHLHFVVEDDDQNRVGLIGGHPGPQIGRTVVLVGTFRVPDVGRWIEVGRLGDSSSDEEAASAAAHGQTTECPWGPSGSLPRMAGGLG